MRRTSHPETPLTIVGGPSRNVDRDAFRALAEARADYDALAGDPKRVPELAAAAQRLAEARAQVRVA